MVAVALVLPAFAAAHVEVSPAFVEIGVESEVLLAVPNERSPRATVALSTTLPEHVELVSASTAPGWQASLRGSTVTWSGGRIEGKRIVSFPVRLLAGPPAGTVELLSTQRYDDGRVVRWTASLTVLPATGAASPGQHLGRAVAAAAVGLAVIVGSLAALRLLRRRS